jgi:hypothetical protein
LNEPEDYECISLAEALPSEQARVREVLALYKALGPVGAFGVAMIEQDLAAADRATAAGDTVGMLRAYQTLKDIEA